MKTSIALLFYLKKAKTQVSENIPIYMRLTLEGRRMECSTGRSIHPSKWKTGVGRVSGQKEEARELNYYLDSLQNKVFEIQREALMTNKSLSLEQIKNCLSGKSAERRMLIPIFKDHNNRIEQLVGEEYASGTLQRYETSLSHTIEFLLWKFKKSDIAIEDIDHAFVMDFEFFLRSVRKCGNNTTVKYLKNFGKIIRICLSNGWLTRDPFSNYKSKLVQVDRVFLTSEELEAISAKVFIGERLNQIRDIFLFSCYTGLAYADVKKLSKSEISIGIDGEKWIFTKRTKTETPSNIPLLPMAAAIIEKYVHHPKCVNEDRVLPVLSNQKMNSYLKEIADCCGINKGLTFHCARHTFATSVTLNNGVPIESVSKMLGHKNLKITQHYAKILDKKVSEDMMVLRDKFCDLKENKSNLRDVS